MPPDGEGRAILPNLLTKADFEALSHRLGRVVWEEVAQLRTDLSNVEARMSVAEAETRVLNTDLEQTNTMVTNQEADMAHLTMWVDDLGNRGRRMNLRIRGVRGRPSRKYPRAPEADLQPGTGQPKYAQTGPSQGPPSTETTACTGGPAQRYSVLSGQFSIKRRNTTHSKTHRHHQPGRLNNSYLPRPLPLHTAGQMCPAPNHHRPATCWHTIPLGLPLLPLSPTCPRLPGGGETR
ncbi:Hypothetical predicted protein [Pelobates cultripes]|uniref:Uncharacterized protein n=1 Tax=Pelobates cultripes TaxID=61616 RepID=A0AAD1RX47_PELCU|nr:Hypothetical predicted protein [Pelobates cultripes]